VSRLILTKSALFSWISLVWKRIILALFDFFLGFQGLVRESDRERPFIALNEKSVAQELIHAEIFAAIEVREVK
jgi:hypothetical protein